MIKKTIIVASVSLFSLLTNIPLAYSSVPNSITRDAKTVNTPFGNFLVNVVSIDLNDSNLLIKPIIANDTIGSTESLISMANRSGALVAVNGSFFEAFNESSYKLPYGEIVIDSQEVHQGVGEASIGFSFDNQIAISSSTDLLNRRYPNITSAGPILVQNGENYIEKMNKINYDQYVATDRGRRSFIGYKDNLLVIGTTPNKITVQEEAEICLALGLQNAMNLDGGGSSGLVYDGRYITKPQRLLSNAIIVKARNYDDTYILQRKVNIAVNEQKIESPEIPPYINQDGRVMVPLRVISEALGATVQWEKDTQTIKIQSQTKNVSLQLGKKQAIVDERQFYLDTIPLIKNGRTVVPVRFVSEALGAKVNWDQQTRSVIINTTAN